MAPLALALPLAAPASFGQEFAFKPRVQWEVRADGIFSSSSTAQAGAGLNVASGYYVRVGLVVAAGETASRGRMFASARTDFTMRYLLDPFQELHWAPYFGAGFSGAHDAATSWRGYLLALAGIEGPSHGGWRPSLELGLGGGVRAGIVLRRARTNGR